MAHIWEQTLVKMKSKELNYLGAVYEKFDYKEMIFKTLIIYLKKSNRWFQGRMEFGPRALGARSIIGDPRSEKMQKNLNLKVKYRESFRPFAPSILRKIYRIGLI